MVLLPIITLFVFLGVPILSYFNHMSALNRSLALALAISWAMGLNIRAIDVGIPCLGVFEFLAMLSSGNIGFDGSEPSFERATNSIPSILPLCTW